MRKCIRCKVEKDPDHFTKKVTVCNQCVSSRKAASKLHWVWRYNNDPKWREKQRAKKRAYYRRYHDALGVTVGGSRGVLTAVTGRDGGGGSL